VTHFCLALRPPSHAPMPKAQDYRQSLMPSLLAVSRPIDRFSRIQSLDGLRAISIVLVLFSHLCGTSGFWLHSNAAVGRIGHLGVTVFFVISGYLITSLLNHEWKATGSISLVRFYLRRTLRIFPAAYCVICAVSILKSVHMISLPWSDVLSAATYSANFSSPKAWWLGHYWSLSVEEQFYLIWPATLLVLGWRRARWVAVGFVLANPFLWAGAHFCSPLVRNLVPSDADAIVVGCVLAMLEPKLSAIAAYRRFQRSPAPAFLMVVLLLDVLCGQRAFVGYTLDKISNICIALYVHRCISLSDGLMVRFLNSPPLRVVGRMSYSIYLWQQLFLMRASESFATSFPMNLALTAIVSAASYLLIEVPVLRYRSQHSLSGHFPPKELDITTWASGVVSNR
jgi:peptidoglycan/LPS O-acetylase OafA/YrhL